MFARSTAWRQGEGRTWQNATSIRYTFPSRTSRFDGFTSRWAIPAFHSLRTMVKASRTVSRSTSASRISFPLGRTSPSTPGGPAVSLSQISARHFVALPDRPVSQGNSTDFQGSSTSSAP
jgi:hypothetical protein